MVDTGGVYAGTDMLGEELVEALVEELVEEVDVGVVGTGATDGVVVVAGVADVDFGLWVCRWCWCVDTAGS